MQTRRLRLGDVVDDYCPRERRLSNHVVVAMVEDAIKQTRCSTCDFEHPYKDAKVPPRRKKKDADAPAGLYQQVLDSVLERHQAPAHAAAPVPADDAATLVTDEPPDLALPPPSAPAAVAPAAPAAPAVRGVLRPVAASSPPPAADQGSASLSASASDSSSSSSSASASPAGESPESDEGSGYRRNLIRATLPRPVGEVPVRAIPTFTIREAAAARPGKFRHKNRPPGAPRQGRPNGMTGPMSMGGGNQARPGGARNQQGRPNAGKKAHAGGAHGNTAHGGGHGAKGRQGGQGNKRFK